MNLKKTQRPEAIVHERSKLRAWGFIKFVDSAVHGATFLDSMYIIIVLLIFICKSVWYEDNKNLIKVKVKTRWKCHGNKLCILTTSACMYSWRNIWTCETIHIVVNYHGLKQNGKKILVNLEAVYVTNYG